MKKLSTLFFLIGITATIGFSQVTVTYQVDITDYLGGGATLDPNGIRVGGDFTSQGATVADWTPSDASCAMTDLGNNIWSIAVEYPASSIGQTQSYKFVNGDWGTNEGTDPANTIATAGCGIDDGSGNINRQLVIPQSNITLTFCWDACLTCAGDDPLGIETKQILTTEIFPNPVKETLTVEANVETATVEVYNLIGSKVAVSSLKNGTAEVNVSELPAGSYILSLNSGKNSTKKKFIKL